MPNKIKKTVAVKLHNIHHGYYGAYETESIGYSEYYAIIKLRHRTAETILEKIIKRLEKRFFQDNPDGKYDYRIATNLNFRDAREIVYFYNHHQSEIYGFLGMIELCKKEDPGTFNIAKCFADTAISRATFFSVVMDLTKAIKSNQFQMIKEIGNPKENGFYIVAYHEDGKESSRIVTGQDDYSTKYGWATYGNAAVAWMKIPEFKES